MTEPASIVPDIDRTPCFTVASKLGKQVRTTRGYWDKITMVKRPRLRGKEDAVEKALKNPEEIRMSKSGPSVYLYYRPHEGHHLCVVVKHLNGEGHIITSYITSKKLEGKTVWKK